MAKKKSQKIINNIDEVYIEIDYDKLAEAIVKANEKQVNQYSVSREWMKFIIYPVFWGVAIAAGILSAIYIVHGATALTKAMGTASLDWVKAFNGLLTFCIGLFLISICLTTIFTAKEIDKERDRNFVESMFSNIVALVALIISLIALVKG